MAGFPHFGLGGKPKVDPTGMSDDELTASIERFSHVGGVYGTMQQKALAAERDRRAAAKAAAIPAPTPLPDTAGTDQASALAAAFKQRRRAIGGGILGPRPRRLGAASLTAPALIGKGIGSLAPRY